MRKKKQQKKKQSHIEINGGVAYWQEADGYRVQRPLTAGEIGSVWGVGAVPVYISYEDGEKLIQENLKHRKSKKKIRQFILDNMENNLQTLELLGKYKLL